MTHPYIAVEGCDGAGGTTISLALAEALKAVRIVEPPQEAIGNLLRTYLAGGFHLRQQERDEVLAHLFIAARLSIQGAIETHLTMSPVVSDRCLLSSYVYQSTVPWLDRAHRNVRPPDLIVLLNTPPEVAYQRLHSRPHREAFEDLESIRTHARLYLAWSQDPPEPLLRTKWLIVDGTMPVEQMVQGLVNELGRISDEDASPAL